MVADIRKWRWSGPGSLIFFALLALAGVGTVFWLAWARLDHEPPWLNLQPADAVLGSKSLLTLETGDRESGLKEVKVAISQGNVEKALLTRRFPPGGGPGEKVSLPITVEPQALGFKEGKAKLTATVWDRSWRNWTRGRSTTLSREMVIDLVPLRLSFTSANANLHAGGTAIIRYHISKPAKESGVSIDGHFFAGFPVPGGPEGDYVALIPLPRESAGTAAAQVVARPQMGAPVQQTISLKLKPRRWRHDKLNLSENFMRRVAERFKVANPGDPLAAFLEVNREMRKANHERIRQASAKSRPQPLWSGGFQRYTGKAMARFGDRRTYVYQGKDVDHQEHLGEDLASLVHSPVPAANNGVVVMAELLGIYGNSVMLDHGMGVFSMYSHMSQIDVKVGDEVKKGAILGKTGSTGLAAGDHLHFSMILQGEFVDPLEWWDPHWLKTQVDGQFKGAAAPAPERAVETPAKPHKGKGKGRHKPGKGRRPPA